MSSHGKRQPPTAASSTSTTTTIDDAQWKEFSENLQYLWCTSIAVLQCPPTPLEFSRDFVSKSRPCIIRNVFVENDGDSSIPKQLTLEDIMAMMKSPKDQKNHDNNNDDTLITVDVTPDGQGDCVRTCRRHQHSESKEIVEEEIFVQPKECQMTLSEFRTRLRRQQQKRRDQEEEPSNDNDNNNNLDIHGRPILTIPCHHQPANNTMISDDNNDQPDSELPDDSIVYYSRQNDCLRTDFPKELQSLFPIESLDWAQQAFGTPLDAVNLWIGNEAAISSMHKDHYENLFYVASGEKIFTLCPPACVPFLYEHLEYPTAIFDVDEEQKGWSIRRNRGDDESPDETTKVRWVAPDVTSLMATNRDQHALRLLLERYPLLKHVRPIEVRVQQGDLLYLPSLWFHRVTQSCETVGVNFWYDMYFDSPLWCYYSLFSQLQPPPTTAREESDGSCE